MMKGLAPTSHDPAAYFKALGELFGRIEVATAAAVRLDAAGGVLAAAAIVKDATAHGRKVVFIGNGGSAAIASGMAIDYWKNGGMRAIAFNDASLLTCIANDFGYEQVFAKSIEMFADRGDVLIAISSSGQSENILRGVDAAEKAGCRVVTLSGFEPTNPLRTRGDVRFWVPSGAYAHVELVHQAICDAIRDRLIAERSPA
jgi:D-sedoheptulose 7-phosphate isomerase